MRQKTFFIIMLISFLIVPLKAQHLKSDFRVIGYYSLRSAMNDFKKFPFKRLTHVNLFFLNPDSLGNFTKDLSVLVPCYYQSPQKKCKGVILNRRV